MCGRGHPRCCPRTRKGWRCRFSLGGSRSRACGRGDAGRRTYRSGRAGAVWPVGATGRRGRPKRCALSRNCRYGATRTFARRCSSALPRPFRRPVLLGPTGRAGMSDCWAIAIWPGLRPSTRRDRGCALRLPAMELRVSRLRWRQTSCCMSPLISAYILQDLHTTVLRRELGRPEARPGPRVWAGSSTANRYDRPASTTPCRRDEWPSPARSDGGLGFYTCICGKLVDEEINSSILQLSRRPIENRENHGSERIRMKLLLSAYACAPNRGSDYAVGWNWATEAHGLGHEVWVLASSVHRSDIQAACRLDPALNGIQWVFPTIGFGSLEPGVEPKWERTYNLLWQQAAVRHARDLHRQVNFDAVHHATWAGVRAPTFLGTLGPPLIVGTIGRWGDIAASVTK